MFTVYAKDIDHNMGWSERYQETLFLGVYSTLEKAKNQIEYHKNASQCKFTKNTPRVFEYYVYSSEIDQQIIIDENNADLFHPFEK
jgi:hypothetical protein